MLKKNCTVIVVRPLKSILEDQVSKENFLGLKAGALSQITMGEAELLQFELLLGPGMTARNTF